MPMNFGNGGRFSFGPLSAVDQGLFENNHDVAFQKLLDWMGNGNPNFGSTTAGRYAQQQQGIWNNRFLADQSAQTDRFAAAKGAWDQQEAQRKSAWDAQKQANAGEIATLQKFINDFGRNPANTSNPALVADFNAKYQRLNDLTTYTPGTYAPPEDQLTWTKWLEQHQGDAGTGFNELTAGQRGANPGAFQIRRNIW